MSIPNEIWCKVFEGVSRSAMFQCMRVCKAWQLIVTPFFYESIVLSGDAVIRLRSKIEETQDIDSLVKFKTDCGYVKKLVIKDEPYLIDLMPALFVFLFANLKSIDFSKSYFLQEYMNFFIESPKISCLKLIEEIFPPANASLEHVNSYYRLCSIYRNTLLKFPMDYIKFNHPSEISSLLPNFAKLTHLFIKSNQDDAVPDIFSLINFCPNLIAFEFATDSKMDILNGKTVAFALSLLHQNLNTEGSFLQVLDLHFSEMTPNYFEYFTICLSSYRRLQVFSLHLDNQSIYEWIQYNNSETLLQFADILNPVDSLDIQMSICNKKNEIIPSLTRDSRIMFLDKYWDFINCIKGNQWLDCLTTLGSTRVPYQHIDHTVQSENSRMHISDIEHQYWDYLQDVNDLNTVKILSGQGAKYIDCLDFNNVPISKAIDVLNFALLQCPQLAQLSIITDINSISFSISGIDCYAKDIDIRSLAVGDQIINKAIIHNCSAEFTEGIMAAINTHLPGIQDIEIVDFYSKSYEQEINLSGIRRLKNIIINNTTPLDTIQPWCLVVIIDNGKGIQYYSSQVLKGNPRHTQDVFEFRLLSWQSFESLCCNYTIKKQEMIIKCPSLDKITFKINHELDEVLFIHTL